MTADTLCRICEELFEAPHNGRCPHCKSDEIRSASALEVAADALAVELGFAARSLSEAAMQLENAGRHPQAGEVRERAKRAREAVESFNAARVAAAGS